MTTNPGNREENIEQRQRDIRQSQNTAQAVFQQKITEIMAAAGSGPIQEIQFPVSLSGSLNFSILPVAIRAVLARLRKLSFIPGEITDIQGWEEIRNVSEVQLPRQLLTEIDVKNMRDMITWKVLNLEGNGIREIEWKRFFGLRHMNLAYNRVVRLALIPRSLEILDVRNNRLELLDLSHGENLRYVNASNNTTQLILIPPPQENTEVEIIQTSTSPYLAPSPISSSQEDSVIETKRHEKKGVHMETAIRHVDFQEGLKEYFRYKAEYERKVAKEKRDIWNKYRHGKRGSVSLARQMLTRYVPTCLNCQQPGGMIFQFLPEEKKYKGLCGASGHPCNFRLDIFRSGDYMRLTDLLQEEMRYSEECKQKLIMAKQEIFFGYVDELSGLKKNKTILQDCEETATHVRFLQKDYENLYDAERRKRIQEYTLQLGQWVSQHDALMHPGTSLDHLSEQMSGRYTRSHLSRGTATSAIQTAEEEEEEKGLEEERLRIVVETEVCDMFPLVRKLREETYDVMRLEPTESGGSGSGSGMNEGGCRLVQQTIAFSKGEYNLGVEEPAVLHFSQG